MTRCALLLSYEDISQRMNADILRMRRFLSSPAGGAWAASELPMVGNAPKAELRELVGYLSRQCDFFLLYYSGPADTLRRGSRLPLNSSGESISTSRLEGLVPRQVNIYDGCSRFLSGAEEERLSAPEDGSPAAADEVRSLFARRLSFAQPRQLTLHASAAAAGQDGRGGIYTSALIDAAETLYGKDSLCGADPFFWKDAHRLAAAGVAFATGGAQTATCADFAPLALEAAL